MRLLIGLGLLGLAVLAGALLAVGARAQESPPGLGASIRLEALSASGLSVTWSWSGRAASAFEVAWRAGGDDDQTAWRSARKDAAARRHVIENLDAGVRYIVRVRGLDADGRPIDDLRGIFATTQSAPRLLRVIASDDGALTLSWSPPSDWTPQGWRLSWRVAGSQTPGGTVNLPASARSRRIDGLTMGADYRIRLTALNSRGGESPAQTLRATAADAGLATPKLTALSWSGLTIRAEWEIVPRASGYDLIWRASDESSGLAGRLEVTGASAEFELPAAGAYWVELQARIGSGPTAVRSDRTPPRNLILRPAPHYLRALSFDGERARLTWLGTNAPHYDLEWGERGGAKQIETRDGRSTILEVGPLEGGKTYEFRVRARNVWGESGWSATATLTPTLWPQLPPLAALNRGSLYVLWPPAAGAEWYEAQWVNAADPAETARVRASATPTEGGSIAARIGREGGFEDGRWLVRVRAGPWGTWSIPYALDLAGQPPRLALALESSRELCTAGTLTEVSWKISGGSAPYALSVENSAVDVSTDNVRVNCGALTEAEAGDAEAALAAKTVSAVVTDSRGVQRQAALDVARARALPPPTPRTPTTVRPTSLATDWATIGGAHHDAEIGWWLIRWRPSDADSGWSYNEIEQARPGDIVFGRFGGLNQGSSYTFAVAALRDPIEQLTPDMLVWSGEIEAQTTTKPTGVGATSTHDTVTVTWDDQTEADVYVMIIRADGAGREEWIHVRPGADPSDEATFINLEPETEYDITVAVDDAGEARLSTSIKATTAAAPADWQAPPRGAQNLQVSATHDTITVTWDAPVPNTRDRWVVYVEHPSWYSAYNRWVSAPLTVTLGPFTPETTYTVSVVHLDLYGVEVSTTVTTADAPVHGQQGQSPPIGGGPPGPLPAPAETPTYSWPYRFSLPLYMTADPWIYRLDDDRENGKLHAGLDIAGMLGISYDKTILAAADGILRVYRLASDQWVVYCPETATNFDEQFHISRNPWGLKGSTEMCGWVVSKEQGLVALILHGQAGGRYHLTKYAHLEKLSPDIARRLDLSTEPPEGTHGESSVRVIRGQAIGHEGSTGGNYPSHLHFEMRWFDGTEPAMDWYQFSSTTGCSSTKNYTYCAWAPKRTMATVLDPEAYFPPPPASRTRTSPSSPTGAGMDLERRAFSISTTRIDATNRSSPRLEVDLTATAWRPKFYTYGVDYDWQHDDPRVSAEGIEGTRPGVTGYQLHVRCDGVLTQLKKSSAADTPGDYGEVSPFTATLELAAGDSCTLQTRATNERYPNGVDVPWNSEYGKTSAGGSVRPPFPKLHVDRLGPLVPGTDDEETGELTDVEFHFYEFDAVPNEEHVFTPTIGNTGDVSDLVLEVWGPDGLVKYPNNEPVSTKNFAKSARPLSWTPPSTTTGPHFLLVRAGHSTSVPAPEGTYRLRAKLPFVQCSLSGAASESGGGGPVGASEDAAGAVDDGGGGSTTPCRPQAPTGPTVTARTPVRLTVSWTAGVGASFHEVKATTRANCNEKSETYETPSSNSATSHPLTGLTPNTSYRLCVRSVRTIGSDSVRSVWAETTATMTTAKLAAPSTRAVSSSDITTNTITLRWSKVPDADGYEVKATKRANCNLESETYDTPNPKNATSHPFPNLDSNTNYRLCVRATLDDHSAAKSAWASRSARTATPPPTPVTPDPSLSLTVSVRPARCYPGATVKVDWRTSGGRGTPTVTVNGDSVSTSPTSLVCQPTAGRQSISVTARDSIGTAGYSTSATVLAPPVPSTCLSGTAEGSATYDTGTSCGAVTVSALLSVVQGANSDICTVLHYRDDDWLTYGVASGGLVIPGSMDYTVNPGNALWLGSGSCGSESDSGGAGGASSGEPPHCPDALKPEAGPAAVGLDGASCAIVRGGGAVQVSRGDYTLSLSLPSERDWFAAAPTHYNENAGGAFLLLDLASGGWAALNPADGAELARYAPADADGLPALLDALAASASAPE